METQDYSRFREIDINNGLPISFMGNGNEGKREQGAVLERLDKLGIKTLEDLFIAYDKGYFNDKRRKYDFEIKRQTELLMSYYMGTPLINDEVLEQNFDYCSCPPEYEFLEKASLLREIGITIYEATVVYDFYLNHHLVGYESISVADLLKAWLDKHEKIDTNGVLGFHVPREPKLTQNLKFKASFLLGYYQQKLTRKRKAVNVDESVIKELEQQMDFLLKIKDSLDAQIALLQNQISIAKSVGGMKK